jgi:hypothetical protein
VFGTVVDWRSGVIRDVSVLAAEHGADIDGIVRGPLAARTARPEPGPDG